MNRIILFSMLTCVPFLVHSQGLYNNGVDLVFNNNVYLYLDGADGNYLNEDAAGARDARIDGTGTFILEGDWTNNASNEVFINAGTVVDVQFNGSATQTIGAASSGTQFEDLTVNNSAGGTAVDINYLTEVSGNLTLTDGVVATSSTSSRYLDLLVGSSVTDGGASQETNDAFVDGPIRKYGSTDITLPVGESGAYAPVSIANLGAADANTVITAEYHHTAYADQSTTNNLHHVSYVEYWDVTPSGTGVSDADVTIYSYDNSRSFIQDASSLVLGHYNGSDWDLASGSGSNDGVMGAPSYASKANNNDFSPFTFATTDDQNPLHVSFCCVDAYCDGNDEVKIEWSTLSESQIDYFLIEKSESGLDNFVEVGKVEAVGTSTVKVEYPTFSDRATSDISYYKIIGVNDDGVREAETEIMSVSRCGDESLSSFDFSGSYVKNSDFIQLEVQSAKDANFDVYLQNIQGQVLFNTSISVREGQETHPLNTQIMATGVYMLILQDQDTKEMHAKKVFLHDYAASSY